MKHLIKFFTLSLIVSLFLTSCDSNDSADLNLNLTGLEQLGTDYAYEGWIMVDGSPVSTGVFSVDSDGNPSNSSFEVSNEDLESATAFVLTIEPSPDPDPAPSAVKYLAGDFSGNTASLTISHPAALGTDFTASSGNYILATPTDGGSDTNEFSGVWWLDPTAGPGPGLDLPSLPNGWVYEGWAVIDGTPLSTGRFSSIQGADDFNGFSGTQGGPPFPGEDFLQNAPSGLNFPVDLRGQTVVISVEPSPDNSAAPFTLKPLVSSVLENATDHSSLSMSNNAIQTNPTGTVSR